MATKKQLAALARGRAIRLAKIKNRKSSKKTKSKYHKRTRVNFAELGKKITDFSNKSKAVADVAGNIFAPISTLATGIDTIQRAKKAIGSLFEDSNRIDSSDLKVAVFNMKKNLKEKFPNYKEEPVFTKLDEIYKNLLFIEMLTSTGQEKEAQTEIRNTLYLLSRVLGEYNELMKT